ncbi:hypothetical protein C4552_01675 [Candidatus Parcubacteria bacterium]|nr:MAG: hypothetical protein C4552_01675 [Candidatus Parcubacteria bacterium]
MNPNLARELQPLLEQERHRLEAELGGIATKDPRMVGDWDARMPDTASRDTNDQSDIEEQADVREEYETRIAQEQALEERLAEVRKALERIAAGSYGACLACGKPIPEERLRANPAAAYHIEHEPESASA